MTKKKQSNKSIQFELAVEKIQRAAMEATGSSIIPTELDFQQALSIHLRSKQLARENQMNTISKQEKHKQINACWRKRELGKA